MVWRRAITRFAAITVLALAGTAMAFPAKKPENMAMATASERVAEKDWDLLDEPVAASAAPELLLLLQDHDREVRHLALHVLARIGGEPAKKAIAKALEDVDPEIRGSAARLMLDHPDALDAASIYRHLREDEDEYVREHMALVIGLVGDEASIRELKAQAAVEPNRDARHAIGLALARLGDAEGREAYLAQLRDESPATRARAVKDYAYVRDQSALPAIAALVGDRADAINVAPGGHRWYKRVCDVVIDTFHQQLGIAFPFEMTQVKRYSDDELRQGAEILAQYLSQHRR
ncbi:MAG: HEAT repeat domain-containing protein [Proteobacteria bacterium]|nr:HEAT repeat domain-containing protein [Pseudomonadota bacterium]